MLSWIATSLSLLGCFLNARKKIACWPIWVTANFVWIYYTVFVNVQPAQTMLWVVFQGFNFYGWYNWHRMEKTK